MCEASTVRSTDTSALKLEPVGNQPSDTRPLVVAWSLTGLPSVRFLP